MIYHTCFFRTFKLCQGAEFKKSPEDKYSDDFSVSEDIEEDIDSFLNSALDDNNENFTQESFLR